MEFLTGRTQAIDENRLPSDPIALAMDTTKIVRAIYLFENRCIRVCFLLFNYSWDSLKLNDLYSSQVTPLRRIQQIGMFGLENIHLGQTTEERVSLESDK